MREAMKARIDKFMERWISRKLSVWVVATAFLASEKLTSDDWVAISLAYIGIQGVADIAASWKHGPRR